MRLRYELVLLSLFVGGRVDGRANVIRELHNS